MYLEKSVSISFPSYRFLQPNTMEEKSWFNNETILYNLAQRARQFKQFTDQNSAPQKSGYLVRFMSYRDDEPFNVFSFSGPEGQSKSEPFNIPNRPEKPMEKKVEVDQITLGINRVPYGNPFYQNLVVFWKRQGKNIYWLKLYFVISMVDKYLVKPGQTEAALFFTKDQQFRKDTKKIGKKCLKIFYIPYIS